MPKIDVYEWDGVDLVSNPLQRAKGSLETAQNVEISRDRGKEAIRKRAGLAAINSSALNTPIRGAVNVPLPGVNQKYIYTTTSGSWARTPVSSPGVITAFQAPDANLDPAPNVYLETGLGAAVAITQPQVRRGKLLYCLQSAPAQSMPILLLAFDGANTYVITYFPDTTHETGGSGGSAATLFLHRSRLIVGVPIIPIDPFKATTVHRVYEAHPTTGNLRQIGSDFAGGEHLVSGASYLGKMWIGTNRSTTGRIHSAAALDTATWAVERTAAANHVGYSCMAVYGGELFAGTAAKSGTAAIVEKRTAAGVWSTSLTGGDSAQNNYFQGFIVYQGALYAFYTNADFSVAAIYRYNGSSWSTDLDLDAQSTGDVRGAGLIGQDLYVVTAAGSGKGIWRQRGGSWSNISGSFASPEGLLFGA